MNVLYLVAILAAVAAMEFQVGGTRLLFSLPAYAVLGVAALASLRDIVKRRVVPNPACLITSALLFSYLLIRGLTSPVAYLAWPDLFSILGSLSVYLLVACHVTDSRKRLWILGGLLALAFVNLAIGAYQFTTPSGYMLFGFLRPQAYLGRASGLYICPNHLAGFLEIVGSLTLAAALWSRAPWVIRLLFGYGSLCCFAGILITVSRGGFLSAAVALMVLALLGLRRSKEAAPETFWRRIIAFFVVAALAVGGVTLAARGSDVIARRGAMIFDRGDSRTLLWPAAIKQFESAPTWGAGAGTYLFYGRRFRDPSVQLDPIYTHNDYLELLAEYGAVAAALMLVFLGAHVRWGWRAYRHLSLRIQSRSINRGSNAAALNIGALTALAAIATHSTLDFNLHIPANALVMAFVFGILANPGRDLLEGGVDGERIRGARLLPRLALPALGVGLLVFGLPLLPGEYHGERARVSLRDGKPMAALNEANLGLERERHNPWLYFYLGEARQVLADRSRSIVLAKSFREASIEPYREGVKLFPEDIRLLLRLSEALTLTGHLQEAGEYMDRAVEWDPLSGSVQTYYGFYLQKAGRLREAQAAYERANALNPNEDAANGYKRVKQELGTDGASG